MSNWKICRVQYDDTKSWSLHILERYSVPEGQAGLDSEDPDLRARVEVSGLMSENERATIEIDAAMVGWRIAEYQVYLLAAKITTDERITGSSMFQLGDCVGIRVTGSDIRGVLSAYFSKDLAL